MKRKIKVGLDLDRVLIDKPPFVPQKLLEWLVRSHKDKNLAYRFPCSKIEQKIRILSHHHFFRPPIKKNLETVKKLAKKKEKYQLYLISGRYSFLKKQTQKWLRINQLEKVFDKVYLNLKNEQPHLFKEKMIKNLGIDIFVDDDILLAKYLSKKVSRTKVFYLDLNKRKISLTSILSIKELAEVFKK